MTARTELDARIAMMGGPVVVLAMLGWLAGHGAPDRPGAAADAARVLITSTPWAAGWLVAAVGLGWPLRQLLVAGHRHGLAIQTGLGVTAMLVLDSALGSLGVLQWGGSLGAWALVLAGFGLVLAQLLAARRAAPVLPLVAWAALPAVAVLLLAACSAPGWLWASEFGGYDALSYHLQLPAEWLERGRIEPLSHNVYSYLPGYMEAAYYHLTVLVGDGIAAVYACQLLHAGLTVLTAAITGLAVAEFGGRLAGAFTAAVLLGTPWSVVVGSLAYNEMAVTLLLAAGLLLAGDEVVRAPRGAAALGVLAAGACGAKLTAAGLAAAPLGLLMLLRAPSRRWAVLIAAAGGAGLLCLSPWLVRNWACSGNPLFPFATGVLGEGHWSAQQAAIWTRGHLPDVGWAGRLTEAWNQFFRYGIGPGPDPAEPWIPQWLILPWLAIIGLALGTASDRLRGRAGMIGLVLVVQLLFWATLTHIKSRFMLPALVPAAMAVGLGVAAIGERLRSNRARQIVVVAAGVLALAWCCLPAVIFMRERDGAPAAAIGAADLMTGERQSPRERAIDSELSPEVYVNYRLPAGSRILLVGDATPLYYRADVSYQTTWDRGPLSHAMEADPLEPHKWLEALRKEGFTHLMVNVEMLEIWDEEGWNDPRLTAEAVLDFADRFAQRLHVFPNGSRLYRLERPETGDQPPSDPKKSR